MSNLYKTTALLFSIVLLYINTNTENYGRLITIGIQNSQCENLSPYFAIENSNLYFPNRQGERFLKSIKDLPVSNLRTNSNDLYTGTLSPEIRKLYSSSQYLTYSEIIYPSLTNCDKVFPFHYFW
jgi:hypothetical protein